MSDVFVSVLNPVNNKSQGLECVRVFFFLFVNNLRNWLTTEKHMRVNAVCQFHLIQLHRVHVFNEPAYAKSISLYALCRLYHTRDTITFKKYTKNKTPYPIHTHAHCNNFKSVWYKCPNVCVLNVLLSHYWVTTICAIRNIRRIFFSRTLALRIALASTYT